MYISLCIFHTNLHSITIMIDPIGDGKYTGREIEDTFERSLTLQCAQELKQKIESLYPHTQVILTRIAGEILQPLQNASYANRMNINLYIALSFYHEETIPGYLSIFYYVENSLDLQHKYNPVHFYHISQAYLANVSSSSCIAKKFDAIFKQKNFNPHFLCLGSFGIPCMPLFGIQAPAIYLEAGLARKNDWKYLIEPILHALEEILL